MKSLWFYFLMILLNLSDTMVVEFEPKEMLKLLGNSQKKDFQRENSKNCNDDNLMKYLAEMQVADPENIIRMATIESLDNLCRNIFEKLSNMVTVLKYCQEPSQNKLYYRLTRGVNCLFQKLCLDSEFRKDFLSQRDCLKSKSQNFETCSGSHDWIETSSDEETCLAYGKILRCFVTIAQETCGSKASEIIRQLTQFIIDSVLVINCSGLSGEPCVKDLLPPKIETEKKFGNITIKLEEDILKDTNTDLSKDSKASKFCKCNIFLFILIFLLIKLKI